MSAHGIYSNTASVNFTAIDRNIVLTIYHFAKNRTFVLRNVVLTLYDLRKLLEKFLPNAHVNGMEFYLQLPNGALQNIGDEDITSLRDKDALILRNPSHDPDIVALNTEAMINRTILPPWTASPLQAYNRKGMAFKEVLNAGHTPYVFKGYCLIDDYNKPVAIKIPRVANYQEAFQLEQRLHSLSHLQHPMLLSVLGVCRDLPHDEGLLAMIMDLMAHGTLNRSLHNDNLLGGPSAGLTAVHLRFALDIAMAMRYLHSEEIIHGNLKSSNVFLDHFGRCKVANYGQLPQVGENSVAWTAPEILTLRGENNAMTVHIQPHFLQPSADVYSFGVILWELWTRRMPWQELDEGAEIVHAVSVEGRRLQLQIDGQPPLPDPLCDLLERCFGLPEQRPSFDKIYAVVHQQLLELIRERDMLRYNCPSCFLCPLSMEVMHDPVLAADGQTYERWMISRWLQHTNRSPVTNEELAHRQLRPNFALRLAIGGYFAVV